MMNKTLIGLNLALCLFVFSDPAFSRQRKDVSPARREFDHIERQINKFRGYHRHSEVNSQAFNEAACIPEDDRCPTRLTLKRITNLAMHLSQMPNAPDLSQEQTELYNLAVELKELKAERKRCFPVFEKAVDLRRRVALKNPLLNFDKILFIKRHFMPYSEERGNYMCDQYFGYNAIRGGGLFVLNDPFSDNPTVNNILADSVCSNGRLRGQKLDKGGFLSPELSYDGKTIYFAYTEGQRDLFTWNENTTYHIFKVNTDGTGLTQLTDGKWNDFDPCILPNGKIVFISERRGGFSRCHGRPVPGFTLHSMNPDGSEIIQLSHHETNEWQPSINHDGMIVYTRWDYVDRGLNQAHHPWVTTPDGRDPRSIHGNFAESEDDRPHMEMDIRSIPGSKKYIATAAPHHGQSYGSLVLIDPSIEDDDAMSQVRRITPDTLFPEAETKDLRIDEVNYATAWPLSEHFYICVYSPQARASMGPKNSYGIYLVDAFGNKELLYKDREISCLSPIPLRQRKSPPIIPDKIEKGVIPAGQNNKDSKAKNQKVADSEVAIVNVYDSLKPFPENTKIKSLRIIQVLPKTTPLAVEPRIGYGYHKGARAVLGTVPVEEDGSAYFKMPSGIPVYFQALDENGLAVQSMRSSTYTQPGDRLVCQGCHEPKHNASSVKRAYSKAMKRPPSEIKPDVDGSNPFSFPRLVQPVLNKNCVKCHDRSKDAMDLKAGKINTLKRVNGREKGNYWFTSYINLRPYAFFYDDENWTTPRTVPGKFGAKASKLYKLLLDNHHNVKLSKEEMYRISLWLDCNSDFFGSYENLEAQAKGEVVYPTLE